MFVESGEQEWLGLFQHHLLLRRIQQTNFRGLGSKLLKIVLLLFPARRSSEHANAITPVYVLKRAGTRVRSNAQQIAVAAVVYQTRQVCKSGELIDCEGSKPEQGIQKIDVALQG